MSKRITVTVELTPAELLSVEQGCEHKVPNGAFMHPKHRAAYWRAMRKLRQATRQYKNLAHGEVLR